MVKIKASKYMDASPIGPLENFICRIPKKLREQLNVNIGDTVNVCNNNGKMLLKVGWVYENDEHCYPNYDGIFLTSKVYKQLSPLEQASVLKVKNLTIGADPEAYLINSETGNLVEASVSFNTGYIGHDFGLVEFRPDPADSVQSLLLHLYTLIMMSQMYTKANNHIHAASMYLFNPAGFHIHFGKKLIKKENIEQFMKILAYVLDFFVAIPAMYFERGDDWCRRVTSEYGTPGDIRESSFSFEYRTLGGHVLADPRITLFILAIAYTIVSDLYQMYTENEHIINSYNIVQQAYPTLPSREIVKEMLLSKHGRQYAKKYIEAIVHHIDSFSKYHLFTYFETISNLRYSHKLVESWMFNTKFALNTLGGNNNESN